jgi:hypothetical protein
MILSFLALPVIPHLKVTDRGLFDADRFEFIPLTRGAAVRRAGCEITPRLPEGCGGGFGDPRRKQVYVTASTTGPMKRPRCRRR